MGALANWWRSLAPTERIMIAVGVPAVAVAAILATRRGGGGAAKVDAKATQAAQTAASYTGPPEFPDTGTLFELRRQLTEYMADQPGLSKASTAGDPCTPGKDWDPSKCSDVDIINACKISNGNSQVLQEMYRRMVSVNNPALQGTSCGVQYVRYLLEHGAKPA